MVLGEVVQYSFVEGGKHVEFSGGHQVDEVPANVVHVSGRRLLDSGAARRQQADHGATGVIGVGLAADQPVGLHAPNLVGETALLPAECVAQGPSGHAVPVESREQRQDLVVGPGEPGFLQASVQVNLELMMRVDKGSPGAGFTSVQPVRIHRSPCFLDWLSHLQNWLKVEQSTFSIVAKAGRLMGSFIGTGNVASALAGWALAGGATVGTAGAGPAGDIILAVPYAGAATVIGE